MRKKIIYNILLLLCIASSFVSAQQNARNGYILPCNPASKELKVLVIFAEVVDEPNDPGALGDWQIGSLPPYAGSVIDLPGSTTRNGYVSKYYDQASFGNFVLVGDYYPNLIQIKYDSISGDGAQNIYDYLARQPTSSLVTANGYNILSDFDKWKPGANYSSRTTQSDGYIDCVMILWRVNSHLTAKRDGGHGHPWDQSFNSKFKVNFQIDICNPNYGPLMEHEFAHAIMGHNPFHSATAGAGPGTFLADIGGYSILPGWNYNLVSYNGWDRWWLGWKNSSNQYYISARNDNNQEVNSDLIYGQAFTNISDTFTLRDFQTYGDAVRIKLPYLKTDRPKAKNQYLWIENHQIHSDNIEGTNGQVSRYPKGLRFNYEIGNDSLTYINSSTNNVVPLCSFGNYDFTYSIFDSNSSLWQGKTSVKQANPLTGYHLIQTHMFNTTEPNIYNGTTYTNNIFPNEGALLNRVLYNDTLLVENYSSFGNKYDVFNVDSKIGISSNPTLSPLLTYRTDYYRSSPCLSSPNNEDNRFVYLNGLSVKVLSKDANGNIKVKIRWDDFDVNDNVRWCGPIILNEKVILNPNKTITLDQGTTPTRPVNPIIYNNEKVFADPTTFTCRKGSLLKLEKGSSFKVINKSSLVVDSAATVEIDSAAVLSIHLGSTIKIKRGATLKITGSGSLDILDSGSICIENGANVILQDGLSTINLHSGYLIPSGNNCTTRLDSLSFTGNGNISNFNSDLYLQNETLSTSKQYSGKVIYAGYNITDKKSVGNVLVNGQNIILNAEKEVILKNGFNAATGSNLKIKISDN
jgi:hypothetical protein